MSVKQAQCIVNQIDKDIVDLDKKMIDLVKKRSRKTKRIGQIQLSITKSTSSSIYQSKILQIENMQKAISKMLSVKASIDQKLADKKKRIADVNKLQKEEISQAKKSTKQQQVFLQLMNNK